MHNPMCVKVMNSLAHLEEHFLDESFRILALLMNFDRPLIHVNSPYELHCHLDFILVDDKISEVHHVFVRKHFEKLTDIALFQLYFCNHPIFVVNDNLLDSYYFIIVL